MEPRIQYAQTSDGVSIAYAVFGAGPSIVYAAGVFGDVHLHSSGFLIQATETLVERGWRVIRYDGRGMGSSQRDNLDFSLEGRLRDLEAVIEQTGADRFALCGVLQGGPTAIAYTVNNPDRVSRLVLSGSYSSGADWYKLVPALRAVRALQTMAEEQWEFYTLALANASTGFRDSDFADRFAAAMRAGTSAKAILSYIDANEKIDVTDLLPRVSVPTLVTHAPQAPLSNIDLLRVLASRIPNARLVILGSPEETAPAIDAFLREGEEQIDAPSELPSGTAIILFADIANSTALTERIGDAAFRAKARELGPTLRALIRECGGTPVEGPTLGDGVLAAFTSAREAIEAAVRCAKEGTRAGLPLHVGLHAGDVMREKDPDGRANVYGGAVNIASRVAGLSAPGEVLVSETVRSLARTSAGVRFEDRGEQALKGVADPQRLFAVHTGASPLSSPTGEGSARRAGGEGP